jgi:endo-1,4-beta-xylanase
MRNSAEVIWIVCLLLAPAAWAQGSTATNTINFTTPTAGIDTYTLGGPPQLTAQTAQPHAGWKLVPGGDNLIAGGYWGQWVTASAPATVQVTNGVLTASIPTGYFGFTDMLAPRLFTHGDFGVVATIQTAPGINGLITLTGSLATGTQYWQGKAWVELGTDNNGNYVFFYWDGTASSPALYEQLKTFATPPTGTLTMELLHQQGQFFLYFNGVGYGPFADPGLFSLGYVLPGFEVDPGQQMELTQFAFEVPSSETGTPLQTPVGVVPYVHAGDSLGSLAAVTGRTFGEQATAEELVEGWGGYGSPSAATPGATPDPKYAPKVIGEYSLLTTNFMYYATSESAQGYFTLGEGDAMIAYAKDNGLSAHCHHLIGPNQYLPNWVVNGNFTAAQLTQIMTAHIQTVMGHSKGQCASWDVVNEALSPTGTVNTWHNVWAQTIGPSYIDLAFQTAHQVDPNAKLYYNDYAIENQTAKATGLYTVLAGMQQRGTPIDGVGLQCHWTVGGSDSNVVPDHDSMVANMAQLAKMGLSARISELDAGIPLPASAADLATQATFFSTTVQACLDSPNCTGIAVFGSNDAVSGTPLEDPGYGESTLFDANFQPKPAYTAVMNTLRTAALAVHTAPALTAPAVTNGADYANKGVAPGEIVTLFPTNVGPATLTGTGLDASGNLLTLIGGTRVLFDGVAAPMIYAAKNQVAAVAPYEIAGGSSTQVQVEYNGIRSVAVTVPVLAAVPAIITVNSQGTGQAAALNQDNSLNSASNPAARGSIVTIWATGEGQRNPAGVSGVPAPAYDAPVLPASVTVGGVAASLPYAAASPGFVGLMQINLTVPPSAPTGAAVPVQLTIGTIASPSVTIAVK